MENYYNISYCKKMLTDLLSGDNTYMSPVELGDLLGEFFKSLKDPEIKAKFLENINFNDPLKARLENFFYKDSANMDTDFITKRITTYIKNHDLGSLYSALKTAQNDELTMQCLQYFDNDSTLCLHHKQKHRSIHDLLYHSMSAHNHRLTTHSRLPR